MLLKISFVGPKVNKAVTISVEVFWDVALSRFIGLVMTSFSSEDGGDKFLRNFVNHLEG
jgi:hypothetical protein